MLVKAIISSENTNIVETEVTKGNGEIERKCVSLESYIAALKNCTEKEEEFIHLGQLPYGYVDSKISISELSTFSVVVQLPKDIRPIMYYEGVYQVPFPSLFMYFNVIESKVVESKCFAAVGDETKLYHYPFGNVHSNGKICWGNMNLPKVQTLEEVNVLVSMFLSSDTNDDLFSTNQVGMTQRALIEEIKVLKEFPVEKLRVSDYDKTIIL